MKLVIAEKPSVAQSLAAVIGATAHKDGYLEGSGWRVSWCVGHLAGLADADTYNPDYAKWRYDDLPILPEPWQMVVSKDKKKQFDVLKQLMNAPDVTEVVNACDAGREGELIFRSVYELAGCQKPMKRLWISSMEDSAIREGFANLRPGADYDGLRDAALCRAKADWLVGINATRLFSVLYHRTLNIGRVMSPTLALIVQREAEIDTFKPVPFYTVTLELPGFTVSGERKDLTAEEYVQYATLKGQASYQLIRSLTESEAYRAMSEEEKVQAVKNAYDLATQTAKAEISDFGTESWVRKAVEAQEKYSIPRETYITLKTQVSGLESLKDREGETIDNSRSLLIMEAVYNTPGLSDKQRQAMFEYLGVGKKVRNLNKAAVREKLREMRNG